MDTPPDPKSDPNPLPAPQPPTVLPQSADEKQWAMFCHLAGVLGYLIMVFGYFVGPLIIWLIKKDTMPFVNQEGKESVNFQISLTIYYAISGAATFACVGWVMLPAVFIFALIVGIMATVEASNGRPYRYPLCIRFIQ